jgi:EcsC protein family
MTLAETKGDLLPTLTPTELQMLRRAILHLEDQSFASQLADYAGRPIDRVMRLMPMAASRRLNKAVESAVLNCLNVAITSIEQQSKAPPEQRASTLLAGLSGGVSGFFGLAALPIELPLTTTLMLRAIADIARHHGEDLSTLEARLACVEVFALGSPKTGRRADFGYYATRTLLSRLATNASAMLIERSATNLSAPVTGSLVTEIATRFGLVVSERSAASALPVLGAFGGATVNMIFMNHFQQVASGHFAIRKLERRYGQAVVRGLYTEHAAPNPRSSPRAAGRKASHG